MQRAIDVVRLDASRMRTGVRGAAQRIADAENGTESVGQGAEVSQWAKRFQVVFLFLERILFRVGRAVRSPVAAQERLSWPR